METLLQIGDTVKIRDDIKTCTDYKMRLSGGTNSWLEDHMIQPGKFVTVVGIQHGQYLVNSEDAKTKADREKEEFWSYTDNMFDQELIDFLYIEYRKNNK